MLKIENVSKSFESYDVLKGLNMNLEDGHVFGLVGVNGAGKSTLLRCIAGVYEVDGGMITYDDRSIHDDPDTRKSILFIGDDPYFNRNVTINDLLKFYRSFYELDLEAYFKYLNMFALDPQKPLNSFSKGMKRQCFLLLALAIKPRLLLLDEAFDGLDPLTRLDFKKALAELLSDANISVIISSHNLKELEDICDSFGLLEDGKIKTSGDLFSAKDQVNKYQLVFDEAKDEDLFSDFDVLSFTKSGRVLNLVIRGPRDEIVTKLNELDPLILDVLKIDFEELFIYEVEKRGSLHE